LVRHERRDQTTQLSGVSHFLHKDDKPKDASLLDMSILFLGALICSHALGWQNLDSYLDSAYFEENDVWSQPEYLQSHAWAAGNYALLLLKWVHEYKVIGWIEAMHKTSLYCVQILEKFIPSMAKKKGAHPGRYGC
jgi:hypothetical protein